MPFVLGTVFPGSLFRNILRHFLVEPCFRYDSYIKHAVQHDTEPYHTQYPVLNMTPDTAALINATAAGRLAAGVACDRKKYSLYVNLKF